MARKAEEAEVKKECPSCGLGVALDSKICEFCGWDFEEEDEWILQIEKLERDLIMEKQKFAPGSVDQKIEATLHTPPPRSTAAAQPAVKEKPPAEEASPAMPVRRVKAARPEAATPTESPSERPAEPEEAPVVRETVEVENIQVRTVRGGPQPVPTEPEAPVRRVRAVKPAQAPAGDAPAPTRDEGDRKTKKVRVVRKAKK